MSTEQNFSFEKAYKRLEEILERLNSGDSPLEESLKLFEEADKLIRVAGRRLSDAEQKIQILIKNRQGESELQEFTPPNRQVIS